MARSAHVPKLYKVESEGQAPRLVSATNIAHVHRYLLAEITVSAASAMDAATMVGAGIAIESATVQAVEESAEV